MELVVLGANGRTGSHVVRLALEQGHSVTAVVRSEDRRPNIDHDHLKVVVGDPCDPRFLAEVLRDQDALISTLGGRRPTKSATSIYYRSAQAIVEAARETGLKTVVVTSSALLFSTGRWVDKVLAFLVRNVVRSASRMEQTLGAANLDLVIARCGFLTDAEETSYRAERDALPKNGSSVARQGLAHFLLDTCDGTWTGHKVYGVSKPIK